MRCLIRSIGVLLVVLALVRGEAARPVDFSWEPRPLVPIIVVPNAGGPPLAHFSLNGGRPVGRAGAFADTLRLDGPVRVAFPAPSPSPIWAGVYSLGATAVPIAGGLALRRLHFDVLGRLLGWGGIVLGPALGHVYAGNTRQVRIGIGIRGIALSVGSLAISVAIIEAVRTIGDPGGPPGLPTLPRGC